MFKRIWKGCVQVKPESPGPELVAAGVFYRGLEREKERKERSYLIAALLAAAPTLAWSALVVLVSVKIFTKRNGFAE